MKLTLSVIKADIGSVGGHVSPSRKLVETVASSIRDNGRNLILDRYIGYTGVDIAILMTHTRGEGDEAIHKMAWDAFVAGTEAAKQQGLYGAGQDLLKSSFSGNVRGMGPAVAEMEIDERPAGGMRGSHNMPLMPVMLGTGTSYFDGPPLVTSAGFCVHGGKLTEPVDNFAHPFWNTIRDAAANKAVEMRRQGFFGAAMLPMGELEYTGIMEKLAALDGQFRVRGAKPVPVAI